MGVRVIGIAAAAGGGKTTICRGVAARLGDAPLILFDDYELTLPADWPGWLAAGADFNAWQVAPLVAALRQATAATAVPYVVFEAPLGRAHRETAVFIDTMVFVDVPLEVALARLVQRELARGDAGRRFLDWYLPRYEPLLRDVYLQQRRQVLPGADLVVDGLQEVGEVVEAVVRGVVNGKW